MLLYMMAGVGGWRSGDCGVVGRIAPEASNLACVAFLGAGRLVGRVARRGRRGAHLGIILGSEIVGIVGTGPTERLFFRRLAG